MQKPQAETSPLPKPRAKVGMLQKPRAVAAPVPRKRPATGGGADVRRMVERGCEIFQVRRDGKAVAQCTSRAAGGPGQAREVATKLAAAASDAGVSKEELARLKQTLLAEVRGPGSSSPDPLASVV